MARKSKFSNTINENADPDLSVQKERDWQYNHLLQLLADSKAN